MTKRELRMRTLGPTSLIIHNSPCTIHHYCTAYGQHLIITPGTGLAHPGGATGPCRGLLQQYIVAQCPILVGSFSLATDGGLECAIGAARRWLAHQGG